MEEEPQQEPEQREQQRHRQQCFSVVQSKRFGSPICESTVTLCPSMDLLTLSLLPSQKRHHHHSSQQVPTSSPLWLHRSLSFQKLATITNDEEEAPDDEENPGEEDANDEEEGGTAKQQQLLLPEEAVPATVWSPDGRWLAVTDSSSSHKKSSHMTLYHVEALVKESNLSLSTVFSSDASSSRGSTSEPEQQHALYKVAMAGNVVRVPLSNHNAVCGLAWHHVGPWHPALERSDREDDDCHVSHLYATIRQRYADRSSLLLPPSEYHLECTGEASNDGHHSHSLQPHHHAARHHHGNNNSVVPSSQTPLSLLVVALQVGHLECYLNGRYRIATNLPWASTPGPNAQIVCSNDLSHILVSPTADTPMQKTCYMSMFCIPALAEQRYTFQTLTALYSSIMGHFHALRTRLLVEVCESYKSSLKPLDMKLEALARLLRNYGLLPASSSGGSSDAHYIRKHLVRYILSGHTAGSADLSNAMDQFFTGVQMNDQLIQRMERSLTVAVANVEQQLRKTIAACQALVLETDQLLGLAHASQELIPSEPAQQLQQQCQNLLQVVEGSALSCLVDARFRLRDWIAWLRSVGSQIKARGTASNSVQRDNAKKRRVPNETVSRILSYLQQSPTSEEEGHDDGSMCETLLGISLSRFWIDKSVTSTDDKNKSIPAVFQMAVDAAQQLFDQPPELLKDCIRRLDFDLSSTSESVMAATTRMGAGGLLEDELWSYYGEALPTGFFNPRNSRDDDNNDMGQACRQWAISAQSCDREITVRAVPLPWYSVSTLHQWNDNPHDDGDDSEQQESDYSFHLHASLELPQGYRVHELAFYGDNGKSGLFADGAADKGAGMERRQALTALVSRKEDAGDGTGAAAVVLELWLIPYDRAIWRRGDLAHRNTEEDAENITKVTFGPVLTRATVLVPTEGEEEEEDGDEEEQELAEVLHCRTRILSKSEATNEESIVPTTRMILSGSRGIAAVISSSSNNTAAVTTHLDVLDMEEDEEVEEDGEEAEEMEAE